MEDTIYSNYDVQPTQIQYNLDQAMDYGEMPDAALMAKFEETDDIEDGEDQYYDYAREVAKDFSPDAIGLESDEPRRNYNAKGFLNLRYDGGRGEFNNPRHPEMFLELTENEPRHGMVDPDFKRLREQERFRVERYVRFDADADNSVHEGRWSEPGAFYRSRYAVQKALQPRLRIFSTSKDGRREGLRRDAYPHRSYVNKVEEDMERIGKGNTSDTSGTFAEYITDYALNPQRRTVIMSNEIIRNSRLYQQFTTDHDFAVAKYGQDARKSNLKSQTRSYLETADNTDNRGKLIDGGVDTNQEKARAYKAAGIIMGAMVDQRDKIQQDIAGGVASEGNTLDTQVRKHEALKKDLNSVLWEAKTTHEKENFANQSNSQRNGKMAPQRERVHLARAQDLSSHSKPAHQYINAEIMYKSVKGEIDTEAVRRKMVRDGSSVERSEEVIDARKRMKGGVNGAANSSRIDATRNHAESNNATAVVYKKGKNGVANKGTHFSRIGGEAFASESDNTAIYKYNTRNYRTPQAKDVDVDASGFYDNHSKERHLGSMNIDKTSVRRRSSRDNKLSSSGFDS
jgi:hypothetical protein